MVFVLVFLFFFWFIIVYEWEYACVFLSFAVRNGATTGL